MEYRDKDVTTINGVEYEYSAFYKRLCRTEDEAPAIACPLCHGVEFTISYGNYECIANCSCGNSMVIYDG